MDGPNDRIPIPPRDSFNVGLSACREQTMLSKFGRPGQLTQDCSEPTGDFVSRVRRDLNCGPFKITGLDYACDSLKQIFGEVKVASPAIFSATKTAGMLCVRSRRHNPSRYSNHSWGTAIDIYFGSKVVDQGLNLTNRGNFYLAPLFNRHGWYWGAGFSGDNVDSMHFELADETIFKMPDEAL
ncbi:M15 family metallopeptidase [Mesorhizobium carmichaelinearum]|uniref:M15 family metallopeptidase n=1 Tax=Mesorhizobium carmichaelinearum TaxID=1208188 RepID=UPI000BA45E7C|nr:M15 family metallopeptidase [Mesorhizobium carmichaelinearum]